MLRLLVSTMIECIVISPFIAMAFIRSEGKGKYIVLLVAYFFLITCLLALPNFIPAARLVDSSWNWAGKAYAIVGSLLFYGLCRRVFVQYDYITFKLKHRSSRTMLCMAIIVFVVAVSLSFFSIGNKPERVEYFWFQFTMPGLDEELAFRGIILGLLSNALHPIIKLGKVHVRNPALWITSILFGLVHSFSIDPNWVFHQNWIEFLNAFTVGMLLGWITIKSGSILMSIFVHNLINTLPYILFWI